MDLLPREEFQTSPQPEFCVIWLHGLGASGHDFVPVASALSLERDFGIRFIFPHAPSRPVTVNGGYIMPSWYDIYELDIDRKIDAQQIQQSCDQIHAIIDAEVARGIMSHKIILAGFSQGGAVAYQAALTYPARLGGLLAMSTYFATPKRGELTEVNRELPILIQHGSEDSVVPELLGQRAVGLLKEKGFSSQYQVFPMEHEVCMPQISAISDWMRALFAAS